MFGKGREIDNSTLVEKAKFKAVMEVAYSTIEDLVDNNDLTKCPKLEKAVAVVISKLEFINDLVDAELTEDIEVMEEVENDDSEDEEDQEDYE